MSFQELISDLRKAESQLVRQLGGIRNAISSLEMASAVSPSIPHRRPGRPVKTNGAKSCATAGIYSLAKLPGESSRLEPFEKTATLAEFVGALTFSGAPELGFEQILLVEGTSDALAIQQLLRRKNKEHLVLLLPLGGGSLINGSQNTELQLNELKRITPKIK